MATRSPLVSARARLADLDGTNGFRLDGIDAGDLSGFSVASAGDVNGDGFDDLIVGAPGADLDAGESYVVFGKAGRVSPPASTSRPSTAPTASASTASTGDGAAARSPRPATSTATASPT